MTGDLHPFAERPVKVSNFWFPVNLPPGETTLLLRIKTTSTLYVPLYFSTYNASASQHEELNGLSGAFYGVLFAMFCYNLYLFASLREPAYFWYRSIPSTSACSPCPSTVSWSSGWPTMAAGSPRASTC